MREFRNNAPRLPWRKYPSMLLTYRLVSALILFSISRWTIYIFNTHLFHELNFISSLLLYLEGLKYDIVTLICINIPLILFYIVPFNKIRNNHVIQTLTDIIYIVSNSILVLSNFIDTCYVHNTGKRVSQDLDILIEYPQEALTTDISTTLLEFWYIPILFFLFILVLIVISQETRISRVTTPHNVSWMLKSVTSILIGITFSYFISREALRHLDNDLNHSKSPILVNTPLSLVRNNSGLPDHKTQVELGPSGKMMFHELSVNRFCTKLKPRNVMLIILHGIGQEHLRHYNKALSLSHTPFLDTLLCSSLTFDGRSNGLSSNEVYPAILYGIPALTTHDLISSSYATSKYTSFTRVLKNRGYHTGFYSNDDQHLKTTASLVRQNVDIMNTYCFDNLTRDESLLNITEPFAVIVFIQAKQADTIMMPPDSHKWSALQKNMYRIDRTLAHMFHEMKYEPWYDSTLFIITSDHSIPTHQHQQYANTWGMLAIPIAFYAPNIITAGTCYELAQQVDLSISALSILNIDDTINTFGRNLFDGNQQQRHLSYINNTYQYSDGQYLIINEGSDTKSIYNVLDDPTLDNNLIGKIQCNVLKQEMKEIIQEHNRILSERVRK